MSIFTDQISDFTAALGGVYSCIGTMNVTFPAMTSTDQGSILIANQGLGIVTCVPTGTDTTKKKTSYPVKPGQFVMFVPDQVSNWVALIASRNTERTFQIGSGSVVSTQAIAYANLNSAIVIGTPADYGFPWATVMTAIIYYSAKVSGSITPSGSIALTEDTAEAGTTTVVTNSEVTGITNTSYAQSNSGLVSLTANKKYYIIGKINNGLNTLSLSSARIVISFS